MAYAVLLCCRAMLKEHFAAETAKCKDTPIADPHLGQMKQGVVKLIPAIKNSFSPSIPGGFQVTPGRGPKQPDDSSQKWGAAEPIRNQGVTCFANQFIAKSLYELQTPATNKCLATYLQTHRSIYRSSISTWPLFKLSMEL